MDSESLKDPAPAGRRRRKVRAMNFEPTCPESNGGMRCALPAGHSSWHANPNLTWSDPAPAPKLDLTYIHERLGITAMAKASETTKPSNEERARAFLHDQGLMANSLIHWLSIAFAEVEAEARQDMAEEMKAQGFALVQAPGDLVYRNNPLLDLIEKSPETPWHDGVNQFPAPKSCTCGAASVGSRLHSSWCDAA